jgi:hypothetical protein
MIATIFLGPSLPADEARAILPEAVFRPPAEQGDLLAAIDQDRAEVIGLVDGTFHQNLSVWHNEVCYLLSRGVVVFGASSMGALRAAETDRYGTIGVGEIYRWYRDGVVTADDEVALLHADADGGYRPASVPLVNVRASLRRAVDAGELAPAAADAAIALVRDIHYPDRLTSTILDRCRAAGLVGDDLAAIAHALTDGYVDLKRDDARELLHAVRDVLRGDAPAPAPAPFTFLRSSVFDTLYNLDRQVAAGERSVSLQAVAEHVALHDPGFEELRRASLNRDVVVFLGLLLGLTVTPAEVDGERDRFLGAQGLDSADAIRAWLADNALVEEDLGEYLAQEALCRRLRRWVLTARSLDRGCRALLDEVRMRGTFQDWARAAAAEQELAAAYAADPGYRAVAEADPRVLAARHGARTGVHITGHARVWAEDNGFDGVAGLGDALRRATVAGDVAARIARGLDALDPAAAPG